MAAPSPAAAPSPVPASPDYPLWMKRAAAATVIVWTIGALFAEVVSQVATGMAILLSLLSCRSGPRFPTQVRRVILFALMLALWQAASPFVVQALGIHPVFPPARRYGQLSDTGALAVLACVVQICVPWRAVAAVAACGWLGHSLAAVLQHFGLWPEWLLSLTSIKADPARLRENFAAPGESVRHAGLGLYYHRLKLAHHALAFFGVPLKLATTTLPGHRRARAAGILFTVLFAVMVAMTYARAALGGLVLMAAFALVLALGKKALPILAAVVLAVSCVIAVSPAWQQRFAVLSRTGIGHDRQFSWMAAVTLAKEHPVTGVGFGNFQQAVLRRIEPPKDGGKAAGSIPFNRALAERAHYLNKRLITLDGHNLLLTVFAETGLIGLILFALMHFSLFAALLEKHRAGNPAATAALLAWIGFHAAGVVHYLPYHTGVHLAFCLVWALGLAPKQPCLRSGIQDDCASSAAQENSASPETETGHND